MVGRSDKTAAKAFELFEPQLAAQVLAQDAFSRTLGKSGAEISGGEALSRDGLSLIPPISRYAAMKTGSFSGLPRIVWNGFYADERPKFLFLPDRAKPFRFKDSTGRTFEPGVMDTDGGTIPAALHGFMRYSPWGYGMCYIIHDWLFVAHKCGFSPDTDVSFEDSARILGEAIKTVMEVGFTDHDGNHLRFPRDSVVCMNIYRAVRTPIAKSMWDDTASVVCRR